MRQLRRASRRESFSWPELARGEEGGVLAPPLALDGFRSLFVAHSHYLWIASGCILWLFWYTSDGLRRGEQWIALTYACKAVIGQRLIFCVWGLRPKFNSSASTSSLYTAGNVRQRQRQRQPQQPCQRWWQPSCLPALCSHAVLVVSRHAYQDSERARRWGLLRA